MKRTWINPDLSLFPEVYHKLLRENPVYDSSCSQDARVYYIDNGEGLFLKTAAKTSLQTEAQMNAYFHQKGFGPEVLSYLSDSADWMLTRAVPGEDCTHAQYISDPKRLCDTAASLLRMLHDTSPDGYPVRNRTGWYLDAVTNRHADIYYNKDLFSGGWGFSSAQEARKEIQRNGKYLRSDTLIHGDYCLPNIILRNWEFTGFIDLGGSGLGDRHFDLFWGTWTLFFNLKTDSYTERFLDCYGRDKIQPELLRTVAALEVFL